MHGVIAGSTEIGYVEDIQNAEIIRILGCFALSMLYAG